MKSFACCSQTGLIRYSISIQKASGLSYVCINFCRRTCYIVPNVFWKIYFVEYLSTPKNLYWFYATKSYVRILMVGMVRLMYVCPSFNILQRFYHERPGQISKGPNEVWSSKQLIPNKPIHVTAELMLVGINFRISAMDCHRGTSMDKMTCWGPYQLSSRARTKPLHFQNRFCFELIE
jgi:hypothetical protein